MYNVLFLEKQICHRLEENSCKRSDKKLLTKYLKKKKKHFQLNREKTN